MLMASRSRCLSGQLCFVPAAACLMALPALADGPKVVVTLKPVHALVSQIMDGVGKPMLIVDGSASPHTFTLRPSGAKAITEADVFVRVSESVEPFTRKIAEALPKSVSLVTLSDAAGMKLFDQREGGAFEEHHHEGEAVHDDHGHDESEHDGKDGHIWLDPANAKVIVAEVTKVLVAKFPSDADAFKANAAVTLEKIDTLTAEIEGQLNPVKGKPFIVFHDATQYFEKRFGLFAAGSITISPDVQPSAKRLTAVRKKIAELGATCVFAEPGFQPNLLAAVTEGSNARSGTIDAEGLTLTPGPELYDTLMRNLARNVKGCLQPTS